MEQLNPCRETGADWPTGGPVLPEGNPWPVQGPRVVARGTLPVTTLEEAGEYVIRASVPWASCEDVRIDVEPFHMTISVECHEGADREIALPAVFYASISVPVAMAIDFVTSYLAEGSLTVRVPKAIG